MCPLSSTSFWNGKYLFIDEMQKKIIINWAVELKFADKNPSERKFWNFATMNAQLLGLVGLILGLANPIEAQWQTQSYSKFARKYESTSAQCKAESAFPFFTRPSFRFYRPVESKLDSHSPTLTVHAIATGSTTKLNLTIQVSATYTQTILVILDVHFSLGLTRL